MVKFAGCVVIEGARQTSMVIVPLLAVQRPLLITRHQYCVVWPIVTVSDGEVFPANGEVVLPDAPEYHWYVRFVPDAFTLTVVGVLSVV